MEFRADLSTMSAFWPERESWLWRESPARKTAENFLCEFYNVLWVEEKDGIYYRRTCGRVPKRIWEANATKRHVTLG